MERVVRALEGMGKVERGKSKQGQATSDRLCEPYSIDHHLLDDRPGPSPYGRMNQLESIPILNISRHRLFYFLPYTRTYTATRTFLRPRVKMYRTPQHRPIQRQSVPEGMTTNLTERISILSSAKVIPHDDITFNSPRLVGGYNCIESEDDDDQPTIAVPGKSIHLNDG
jgi:hypothetical protein